ncbi:MAG: hypothetical protein WC374_09330 [Phycisphaerae bacterium]
MITRIKRFSILQTGKMLAVIYFCFSFIALPFFLLPHLGNLKRCLPFLLIIIIYPVVGFIEGIISAAVYNLVAKYIGGLEITIEQQQLTTKN